MDYLHIPEAYRPQALSILYLGFTPKYNRLGFDTFLEHYCQNLNELITSYNLNL
jgi:hypothetical protein